MRIDRTPRSFPLTRRSADRRRRLPVALPLVLAAALVSFAGAAPARAAPPCLQSDNPCDPDKLCTFKAALAEKVLLYQLYLKNSQVTKAQKKRQGVRYSGALYDASVAEAAQAFPNDTPQQLKEKAAQIFQEKVREKAAQDFRLPPCRLDGKVNLSLLPRDGYGGMFTNTACQIRVNYQGGDYDPETFGRNDTTCPELLDRDIAHEVIHQRQCKADQQNGVTTRDTIDSVIEEEIAGYAHSVKLTKAYLRLLSYQCSARANKKGMRTRVKAIESLLAPYLTRDG